MTILMYTIGVFVASLLTIFMVYKFMKRVNRAEFVSLLISSLFSWGMGGKVNLGSIFSALKSNPAEAQALS